MTSRVPFDSLVMGAVCAELGRRLAGGAVQRITMPSDTDVELTIRKGGANERLVASCDAAWPRLLPSVHGRKTLPEPTTFCMVCRKHLEGASVLSVRQIEHDRVAEIAFGHAGELCATLVVELMGKHSNLILLDHRRTILDAAKRIGSRVSRFREVLPGREYTPPPAPGPGAAILAMRPGEIVPPDGWGEADREGRTRLLGEAFSGLSPFLAREIAMRSMGAGLAEVVRSIASPSAQQPVLICGADGRTHGAYPFESVQLPANEQSCRDSICSALDAHYRDSIPRAEREQMQRELGGRIRAALMGRRRQRQQLEEAATENASAEAYREAGDLLLAHQPEIAPATSFVEVVDLFGDGTATRRIAVDPDLSAQQNAAAWYRRYRKSVDGAGRIGEQLERVTHEVLRLEGALLQCADGEAPALRSLLAALTGEGLLREQVARTDAAPITAPLFNGKKIKLIRLEGGFEAYVGENAEANDYLTSRIARPDDTWLHVRGGTSAHVVVRPISGRGPVPQSVLVLAAMMAARRSPARHSSLVAVDYTLRKYVRRPRGAAPGTVTYQNERTLYVAPGDD